MISFCAIANRAWKHWTRKQDNKDGEYDTIVNETILHIYEALLEGDNIELNGIAECLKVNEADAAQLLLLQKIPNTATKKAYV